MKTLAICAVLVAGSTTYAQSGPSADYVPAAAGYYYANGGYTAVTTTGTAGQAADNQPAIGLWGYNTTTKKWYPCGTANTCGFGSSGGSGAPTTNPAGGQNNYAPIDNPTFTTNATSPKYTVSDATAGANPVSVTMATPQTGVTEEVHQANTSNQLRAAFYGGGYSGIDFGASYNAKGSLIYNNGYAYLFTDSQLIFGAPNNGGPVTFTPPVSTPKLITVVATLTGTAPAINAASGLQTITLSGNTTPTISGITQGQDFTIQICQPGTGGPYTWTWPSAIHGGMTIGTTAGACSQQPFKSFNGSTLVAVGPGIANVAP